MQKTRTPKEERFWKHVDTSGDHWMWTGSCAGLPGNRYGMIRIGGSDGKRMKAHILSRHMTNGPIPKGMKVCHRCDITLCVRPDHLFIGTQADNMADCVKKGRKVKSTKLSDEQVTEIRRSFIPQPAPFQPGGNSSTLAAKFGVSEASICCIAKGKHRRHASEPPTTATPSGKITRQLGGSSLRGSEHPKALSVDIVNRARELLSDGLTTRKVANQLSIGTSTAKRIRNGTHWTMR